MKKTGLLVLGCILLFAFAEKELTVKYDAKTWNEKLQLIETAKQLLKNSDAPSKYANPVCDSLSKFQKELVDQLQPQVPKEEKK